MKTETAAETKVLVFHPEQRVKQTQANPRQCWRCAETRNGTNLKHPSETFHTPPGGGTSEQAQQKGFGGEC